MTEAKQFVETWRVEYNESRPHKTPSEFAKEIAAGRDFLELSHPPWHKDTGWSATLYMTSAKVAIRIAIDTTWHEG